MGLSWGGNEVFGLCYNGSTGVSAMYNGQLVWPVGPTPPYTPTKPYLVFRFNEGSFNPNSSALRNTGTWTKVEGSAYNDWYWECDYFVNSGTGSYMYGWPAAFGSTSSPPTGLLTPEKLGSGNTCEIIGYGNLTVGTLESLDRTFAGCTYLISCVTIQTPNTLLNVGGTFTGCVNMEDGMLDQYTYWSTYGTNITNHSGTFTNAGSGTPTGLYELDQIPVGWGGNLVPVSTLMTSSRVKWKSNYDTWAITGNAPTWTDVVNGMYLFTEASVSSYAGVSMNRSRISKFNSLVTTTTAALYFYPCFMQHGSGSITWAVTTSLPNDHLDLNEGNRDMPGTLDYNTYGPFENEYGDYDSLSDVFFCFLVTNVPIADWTGLSDAYGVLYNGNFKTDGGFRWYF